MARNKIDSLQNLLKTVAEDTGKVKILHELTWEYINIDLDTAKEYAVQGLALAEKTGDKPGIAGFYNCLGIIYDYSSDYVVALANYQESLRLEKELGNKEGIASAHSNIGIVYELQGDYPTAIKNYFKSLNGYMEIDDERGIALSYNNLGIVYRKLGDHDASLKNHFEGLKIQKELKDRLSIAYSYNNIGLNYKNILDYVAALEYYTKSLGILKELDNKRGVAGCYLNIGNIYKRKGNQAREEGDLVQSALYYTKAMKNLSEGLTIKKSLGDQRGVAASCNNIGIVYYNQGDYEKSIELIGKAKEINEKIGELSQLQDNYFAFANCYERQGNYQQALNYSKLYSELNDSLFNEKKSKEIGKLEARYEFEKANAELERAALVKSEKEKEETKRRNNLQYSIIVIVLALLTLGIVALGRINIPTRVAEGLIFFTFLLFFEFLLVLLDPQIEKFSGGEPAYKLLFNAGIAGLIFPLHSFFETKIKASLSEV